MAGVVDVAILIRHQTRLLLAVIGCVLVLSTLFAGWTEAIERNQAAVKVGHAVSSQDPGRLEDAENYLSGVLARNPGDERATTWLAYVQMAEGELPILVPLLESGQLADSERGRLMLIRLGDMFLRDLDVAHFRMAWQQARVWGDPPQGRYIQILEAARDAIRNEQWPEALELFRILEAWRPNVAMVHRYLAHILFDGYGDLTGAIKETEQAVALEPESFWDLMSLGGLYLQSRRLTEAQQQFERAMRLDPDHERAVAALADIARRQGRWHEAARLLEAFLEKHPDNDFVLVHLAGLYRDQGQLAEALDLLEAFLERDPDNVRVLVTLGAFYREQGCIDEASELIRRALRHDGDQLYLAWGHEILSAIALSRGDADAAAWHAEQARAIRAAYEARR